MGVDWELVRILIEKSLLEGHLSDHQIRVLSEAEDKDSGRYGSLYVEFRRREKQRSRETDERALASGEKTAAQLQRENGAFSFPGAHIIFDPEKLS